MSQRRQQPGFWGYAIPGIGLLCIIVVAVLLPAIARLRQIIDPHRIPQLPDLSDCTSIEITYHPSALECLFSARYQRAILDPTEMERLGTIKTVILDDPEAIAFVRHEISLASDMRSGREMERTQPFIQMTAYQDGEVLTTYAVRDARIVETESGVTFECRLGPVLQRLSPGVAGLQERVACAIKLRALKKMFSILQQERAEYPGPSQWCDVIVQAFASDYRPAEWIRRNMTCPARAGDVSDYALNPSCAPNSRSDTVLLFETESGWNQHGGPELFTFDNHDPKGGCVLLNDGTVKFIRTEEELHRLRWK